MKFGIGDRVKILTDDLNTKGEIGMIKKIINEHTTNIYEVILKDKENNYHSYHFAENELEFIEKSNRTAPKVNNLKQITPIIEFKNNEELQECFKYWNELLPAPAYWNSKLGKTIYYGDENYANCIVIMIDNKFYIGINGEDLQNIELKLPQEYDFLENYLLFNFEIRDGHEEDITRAFFKQRYGYTDKQLDELLAQYEGEWL